MKLKLLPLSVAIFLASYFPFRISAQSTDEDLQKKYWSYRERLKKYFINYGINPGQSLILHQHNTAKAGSVPIDQCSGTFSVTPTNTVTTKGHLKFGEEEEALGTMMATLALEYRLLKDEGKDVTGVKNELYYMINAINRLDRNAEPYLDLAAPQNLNGFFMRDDVANNYNQVFNNQYPNTLDPEDLVECTRSDASSSPQNPTNVMSQDQVFDLLNGFSFIVKLVDANETAQPTPNDAVMNLVAEVKAISDRIMTHITSNLNLVSDINLPPPIIKVDGFSGPFCEFHQLQVWSNYSIINPVSNTIVPRGPVLGIMAYPVSIAAENISGTSWVGEPLHISVTGNYCNAPISMDEYLYFIPGGPLASSWSSLGNLTNFLTTTNLNFEYCYFPQSVPGVDLCVGTEDFINNYTAAHLMTMMATISKTWTHSEVAAIGNHFNIFPFDLQYSVLHSETPVYNKAYYENILVSAPDCGPYNYNYPSSGTWDANWHKGNRWTHPVGYENPDTGPEFQGDYPGYDFMYLYNLYRYVFKNQIAQDFSNNSCPCTSNPAIDANSNLQTNDLTTATTVKRKFPEYVSQGFGIKEYLTHNLTVNSSTPLDIHTDLVLCNNSILTIQNSGIGLSVGTPAGLQSSLTVRDGCQLIIKQGVQANVFPGSKIIVEKGGTIKLEQGGILNISEEATVTVQDGGHYIMESGTEVHLEGLTATLDVQDINTVIDVQPGSFVKFTKDVSTLGGQAYFAGGNVKIQGTGLFSDKDCYIQFGPDVMLEYFPLAVLELAGNKAVLEIKGKVDIKSNADFTYIPTIGATGYLKFSRPGYLGSPNPPQITCGSNSTITLKGRNSGDKVLEIAQESIYVPDNLAFFTIEPGTVEFTAVGARLNLPSPAKLRNTIFKGTNLVNQTARGVKVFGQPVVCENNNFKNLYHGLYCEMIYTPAQYYLQTVNNCNFLTCNIGLYSQAKGVHVLNTDFTDCGIGYYATGMEYNSKVEGSTFYATPYKNMGGSNPNFGGSTIGMLAFGSPVNLDVKNSKFKGHYTGIEADGNVNLNVACSEVKNNYIGFYIANDAFLNMDNTMGGNGGVDASNNHTTIVGDFALSFDLDFGYNNLKPDAYFNGSCYSTIGHGNAATNYYDANKCPLVIEGNLNLPNCFSFNLDIPANYNYWKDPLNNSGNQYPVDASITEVFTTQLCPSGQLEEFNFTDIFEIPKSQAGNCNLIPTGCATNPADCNQMQLYSCPTCNTISTPHFQNKKTNEAIRLSMEKMDPNVPNGFADAVSMFAEVLLTNLSSQSEAEYLLFRLGRMKMHQALIEGYRTGQITDAQITDPNISKILAVLDNVILNTSDFTQGSNQMLHAYALIEKAQLHRIVGDRTTALSLLNSALLSAVPGQVRYVNHWLCIVSAEKDVITGVTRREESEDRRFQCPGLFPQTPGYGTRMNSTHSEETLPNEPEYFLNIAVYPNPAKDQLNIQYDFPTEIKSASVSIFDLSGKLLKRVDLNINSTLQVIPDLNLPDGVYYFRVMANDKTVKNEKLVILR
jgi:hypothetical protein